MNGMMKRTLGLSLIVASLMVATPAVAGLFDWCKDECSCEDCGLKTAKKSTEIELQDAKQAEELKAKEAVELKAKEESLKKLQAEEAHKRKLTVRFVSFVKAKSAAGWDKTKAGFVTTSSWFAKIFTNFFSWISTKYSSSTNYISLKISQLRSKKAPQATTTLKTVAQKK